LQRHSKTVKSNQVEAYSYGQKIWERRSEKLYVRPGLERFQDVFHKLSTVLVDRPVVLDTGCGDGFATLQLAVQYPDCWILGIDKSEFRLAKARKRLEGGASNVVFERLDLVDAFMWLSQSGVQVQKVYFLYPNPWALKKSMFLRWHFHPVFPYVLKMTKHVELRTNWDLYAQEFKNVLEYFDWNAFVEPVQPSGNPLSSFERKYEQSNHELVKVVATRG
jgi:tRNA (guanine-N7-)-methyltransferase